MYPEYLQRQQEIYFMEWKNIVNTKIQQFFDEKANSNGNRVLQDIVEKLLMNSSN